jgi:hypothetical protein
MQVQADHHAVDKVLLRLIAAVRERLAKPLYHCSQREER